MGEAEGLIIEGARLATAGARDLWWRIRPPDQPPILALVRVRPRLELLLRALFGQPFAILPADADPAPTWLARLLARRPRHLRRWEALAATDGERVWLPRALDAREGESAALDRYRLLAVEQASRAAGGFAGVLPDSAIERDLYRLATAVAVDRALVDTLPGLAAGLALARLDALSARPPMERLRPTEVAVERSVRLVLAAEPATPPAALAGVRTPGGARDWASAEARRLGAAGRYRGVAPVALWGEARPLSPPPGSRAGEPEAEPGTPRGRSAALRRRPRVRPAADDEDDAAPGMWMVRVDDPLESAEDPMGLQRPADQDGFTSPAELGDALAELPEARIVRAPGTPREVLESEEVLPATGVVAESTAGERIEGIEYPEWDYRLAAYRHPGVIVRPVVAAPGDAAWVERVLERHRALVRGVRRRFDGLRPRRRLLGRQLDGHDIDLLACVGAFADRRAGAPSDDRLYTAARPERRDLAIAVLVDVSASTDAWVSAGLRIVDVEKEALVVLLEALDVLGDRHAVLAFSGQGPGAVRMATVKGFEEGSGASARRVAALEPDGYTRVGAAIRHASALLGRERARHRLLLLLSDGKPNDVDEYGGRYGIEDTRQAVGEARLQGLVPFCLTVDREAPTYLPAIFGPGRFAVLPSPSLLPTVLVDVVRSLVVT